MGSQKSRHRPAAAMNGSLHEDPALRSGPSFRFDPPYIRTLAPPKIVLLARYRLLRRRKLRLRSTQQHAAPDGGESLQVALS